MEFSKGKLVSHEVKWLYFISFTLGPQRVILLIIAWTIHCAATIQESRDGLQITSVAECLPSMCEAIGLLEKNILGAPSPHHKKKKNPRKVKVTQQSNFFL